MIRLFVPDDLAAGARVAASSEPGALPRRRHAAAARATSCWLFNGRDGEWRARLGAGRQARRAAGRVEAQPRPQTIGPDLELVVALVKRARLETIVEKAAELGARRVRLAITERTNADRTNVDRLQRHRRRGGRTDRPAGRAGRCWRRRSWTRCWRTGRPTGR